MYSFASNYFPDSVIDYAGTQEADQLLCYISA